jgi:hypothetical protein
MPSGTQPALHRSLSIQNVPPPYSLAFELASPVTPISLQAGPPAPFASRSSTIHRPLQLPQPAALLHLLARWPLSSSTRRPLSIFLSGCPSADAPEQEKKTVGRTRSSTAPPSLSSGGPLPSSSPTTSWCPYAGELVPLRRIHGAPPLLRRLRCRFSSPAPLPYIPKSGVAGGGEGHGASEELRAPSLPPSAVSPAPLLCRPPRRTPRPSSDAVYPGATPSSIASPLLLLRRRRSPLHGCYSRAGGGRRSAGRRSLCPAVTVEAPTLESLHSACGRTRTIPILCNIHPNTILN